MADITYTVVPGDNLSKIARAHNISLSQLIAANPGIRNPNLIFPNQAIKVPGQPDPAPVAAPATAAPAATAGAPNTPSGITLIELPSFDRPLIVPQPEPFEPAPEEPVAPPAVEEDPFNRDAFGTLKGLFETVYGIYGLDEWIERKLRNGASDAEIRVELRQQQSFKDRFPAIEQRAAAGMAPISPEEYIDLEYRFENIMREAGLPSGFYDQRSDFTKMIARNLSPSQVATRVTEIFSRVSNTSEEIRDVFGDFFGVAGDSAIAALALDPDKALPLLMRMVETAAIGGVARRFNAPLSQARADALAGLGINEVGTVQAFQRLEAMKPLFAETITEVRDLKVQDEGLDATLGVDSGDQATIEQRRRSRVSQAQGGGGAIVAQGGILGFGTDDTA